MDKTDKIIIKIIIIREIWDLKVKIRACCSREVIILRSSWVFNREMYNNNRNSSSFKKIQWICRKNQAFIRILLHCS